MRASVRFFCGSLELCPAVGDVLRLSKGHAALLGPTALVMQGPVNKGTAQTYEAEFAEALPTVSLASVTEQDAYTDCQVLSGF